MVEDGPVKQFQQLPLHTRHWINGLTLEKIKRLEQLDKLADSIELERVVELVEFAERAAAIRRFGKWALGSLVAGFLILPQIISAAERILVFIRGPK